MTECIDIDELLKMYLDDYFMLRRKTQKDIRYEFNQIIQSQESLEVEVT